MPIFGYFDLKIVSIVQQLPVFLQGTHLENFCVATSFGSFIHCQSAAEISIAVVPSSASQTGLVENISHPSAFPEISPHTLQYPLERHLVFMALPVVTGQCPAHDPSPSPSASHDPTPANHQIQKVSSSSYFKWLFEFIAQQKYII